MFQILKQDRIELKSDPARQKRKRERKIRPPIDKLISSSSPQLTRSSSAVTVPWESSSGVRHPHSGANNSKRKLISQDESSRGS
jgi:hypothetical protein